FAGTAEGEPITDALFEATVTLPDGKTEPLRLRRQGEQMVGSFAGTQASGDYTLAVTARRAVESIGAAQARFLVFDEDLELSNPAADRGLLESLAAMTSGKTVAPEQLSALFDELQEQTRELEVQSESKDTLWDNWPFMAVFMGLLILEWFLRKKWGLV
ncbi:MAG: hypothetical protein WD403_00770, partial [Pirellulales bacterium]